jgi:hypothetical protein
MIRSRMALLHHAVVHHAKPRHVRAARSARIRGLAAGALVLVLVACGDSASVRIVLPAEGAMVEGGSVTLTLEVSGVTIATAGTMDEGTGHHHLMLDRDLPVGGLPIPTFQGQIHLGEGETEYELTDLGDGEHMVIAVVGDGSHVPLDPWVVDTVRFVVSGGTPAGGGGGRGGRRGGGGGGGD